MIELDELDEYKCPHCGRPNESCFCDEDYPFYDDMDDYTESEYPEEILCYLDGKPIYKSDVETIFMDKEYHDDNNN
jgi:hypothetical protein